MSEESALEPGATGDDDAVADAQAAIDEARRRGLWTTRRNAIAADEMAAGELAAGELPREAAE